MSRMPTADACPREYGAGLSALSALQQLESRGKEQGVRGCRRTELIRRVVQQGHIGEEMTFLTLVSRFSSVSIFME
jgi:hypothetical protein